MEAVKYDIIHTSNPNIDGLNWYAYVGNSPLRWIDPTGLAWIPIWRWYQEDKRWGSFWHGLDDVNDPESQNTMARYGCKFTTSAGIVGSIMSRKGLPDSTVNSYYNPGSLLERHGVNFFTVSQRRDDQGNLEGTNVWLSNDRIVDMIKEETGEDWKWSTKYSRSTSGTDALRDALSDIQNSSVDGYATMFEVSGTREDKVTGAAIESIGMHFNALLEILSKDEDMQVLFSEVSQYIENNFDLSIEDINSVYFFEKESSDLDDYEDDRKESKEPSSVGTSYGSADTNRRENDTSERRTFREWWHDLWDE